jgi:hypothetical protein
MFARLLCRIGWHDMTVQFTGARVDFFCLRCRQMRQSATFKKGTWVVEVPR